MMSKEELNDKLDRTLRDLVALNNNNAITAWQGEDLNSYTTPKKTNFNQSAPTISEADIALEVEKVHAFCQRTANFELSYEQRFHTQTNSNTCASVALFTNVKEIFAMLNTRILPEALSKTPGLKTELQLALMNFLKKFAEAEAQNLAKKYTDIPLETHREMLLKPDYDSLVDFQKYITRQIGGKKAHVLTFRFLLPLVDDVNLPKELSQQQVKPFTDQVGAVFETSFLEGNNLVNGNHIQQGTPTAPNLRSGASAGSRTYIG